MINSILNNKVAIVTGGSSGIGKAIVELLFDKGANVVNADISVSRGKTIRVYLNNNIKKLIEVNLDVRDEDSWRGLYNMVMNEFGKADILINCAGVVSPAPLLGQTESMIHEQIDVNLIGPITGIQTFMPHFIKRKSGHIINISSLGGIIPLSFESVYSAAKFGLRGFTLALALEMIKTGVNVSLVCPDSVLTPQLVHEAQSSNSGYSFSGKFLTADYVASKVYKTILHPKIEVLLTPFKGFLSRIFGNNMTLMKIIAPLVRKIGERKRIEFLKTLENKEIKNACLG